MRCPRSRDSINWVYPSLTFPIKLPPTTEMARKERSNHLLPCWLVALVAKINTTPKKPIKQISTKSNNPFSNFVRCLQNPVFLKSITNTDGSRAPVAEPSSTRAVCWRPAPPALRLCLRVSVSSIAGIPDTLSVTVAETSSNV